MAQGSNSDPAADDFWKQVIRRHTSNPPPPPRPQSTTNVPPPPAPLPPAHVRAVFDDILKKFHAPGTTPQQRDEHALHLAGALLDYSELKTQPAVYETILQNTSNITSPVMKHLHNVVLSGNDAAQEHLFIQQLKKFTAPHTNGAAREALATSMADTLRSFPELRSTPAVFEAIIVNTEGFTSPAIKNLLDATMTDNLDPAADRFLFERQFKKFSASNASVQTQQFYAAPLAEMLKKHPDWVDQRIVVSVAAALRQNGSNPALQALQEVVQTEMASRKPPTSPTPPPRLPKPF